MNKIKYDELCGRIVLEISGQHSELFQYGVIMPCPFSDKHYKIIPLAFSKKCVGYYFKRRFEKKSALEISLKKHERFYCKAYKAYLI